MGRLRIARHSFRRRAVVLVERMGRLVAVSGFGRLGRLELGLEGAALLYLRPMVRVPSGHETL